MSQTDSNELEIEGDTDRFAFGVGYERGKHCPAETVGLNGTHHPVGIVTEVYDDILQHERGVSVDIVGEETAKRAWLDALQNLREDDDVDEDAIAIGECVAQDLGWMGADE